MNRIHMHEFEEDAIILGDCIEFKPLDISLGLLDICFGTHIEVDFDEEVEISFPVITL